MTRFARGGPANQKKPNDPTSWDEMKSNRPKKATNSSEQTVNIESKRSDCDQHLREDAVEVTLRGDNPDKKSKGDLSSSKSDSRSSCKLQHKSINEISIKSKKRKNSDKIVAVLETVTDRCKKSRKSQETVEEEELSVAWKKMKRSEQRREKRIQEKSDSRLCFKCRKPGHLVTDCPVVRADPEQGTGICFKCGSTEHTVNKCRVKLPAGKYPYAKCFICGETGHLSNQCPDNPKGVYPLGGCCRVCTSVEHYQRDCPELQKQQGVGGITICTLDNSSSADAEADVPREKTIPVKRPSPKVVKF